MCVRVVHMYANINVYIRHNDIDKSSFGSAVNYLGERRNRCFWFHCNFLNQSGSKTCGDFTKIRQVVGVSGVSMSSTSSMYTNI